MELSVIIPAYNEAERIGATISAIRSYLILKKHTFEIIVVDDGSTDSTASVVESFHDKRIVLQKNAKNRGKGYAVWSGLIHARYDLALFTDADLSTPIQDLEKLLAFSKTHDVIIGSRNLADSQITVRQPWLRSRLGKTFPLLVKAIALPGIADTQCGFKLFTRKGIETITARQTIHDFGFDVELLHIARVNGLSIKEVGVRWGNAPGSKVRPVRDSMRMLIDLARVRWNHIRGIYTKPLPRTTPRGDRA